MGALSPSRGTGVYMRGQLTGLPYLCLNGWLVQPFGPVVGFPLPLTRFLLTKSH
jgi:hypothetical protein